MIWPSQSPLGHQLRLIGPNCPELSLLGNVRSELCQVFHKPGKVGIVSRSGTLTYEAVWQITSGSWSIHLYWNWRRSINGTSHLDAVKLFNEDPDTEAIILIGEIGGTAEEEAAAFIKENVDKPCAAFIAGRAASGRRMGHAGAIVSGGKGTAEAKVELCLMLEYQWPKPHRILQKPYSRFGSLE